MKGGGVLKLDVVFVQIRVCLSFLYYGVFVGNLTLSSYFMLCLFNLSTSDKFLAINSDQNLNSASRRRKVGFALATLLRLVPSFLRSEKSSSFMSTSYQKKPYFHFLILLRCFRDQNMVFQSTMTCKPLNVKYDKSIQVFSPMETIKIKLKIYYKSFSPEVLSNNL